jgi:carbon monoxide dehydrogenase subunit G
MEVVIEKKYPVSAGIPAAWAVLSDMHALATCMPGAQITEDIDATHFMGSVRVKVGPAVAAFAGTIEILALDAATQTLKMLGKGADKGGSSASMELTASLLPGENGHCVLAGHAAVIVNGKFAQFGGRMMNSVSDMILAQFAEVFSQKAQALQASAPAGAADAGSASTAGAEAQAASPGAAAPSAPAAPIVATEFNALGLVWSLIKQFFAGLFGKKPGA